ncbi:hypothetical protein HGA91_00795 [candidate division WWE3 bacterium]|nr:hypothetical protein [candidate division WWE3 bacterium]
MNLPGGGLGRVGAVAIFAAVVALMLAFIWPAVQQYALFGTAILILFALAGVAAWQSKMGWAATLAVAGIVLWWALSQGTINLGIWTGESTVGSPAQMLTADGKVENARRPGWVAVQYDKRVNGQSFQPIRIIGNNLGTAQLVLLRANRQGSLLLDGGRPVQVYSCLGTTSLIDRAKALGQLIAAAGDTTWQCSTLIGGGYANRYAMYLVLGDGRRMHVGYFDILGYGGTDPSMESLPAAKPGETVDGWPAAVLPTHIPEMPKFEAKPGALPPEYSTGVLDGSSTAATVGPTTGAPGSIFQVTPTVTLTATPTSGD